MTEQEKSLLESGKMLPIMEHFYTIQGEGCNTGKPAYFIRIGGCDVGCHWCDVKESWDASLHPLIHVDDILPFLTDIPSKDVVITGGEPSLYNLGYLCEQLKQKGYNTFIETSGAHNLRGQWDWICLSPKKNAPPKNLVYEIAHELKIIIHNEDDFKWAEKHAAKTNKNCKLLLQPEWSKMDTMLQKTIDYVMKKPEWNISLQSHKFMHIP
ncbi:MAG: 7-carboxy-7-deazaguanine synthase [Saprospiraceae bacterium]|jgi:7-carboxy-7-deazaguanine synthase